MNEEATRFEDLCTELILYIFSFIEIKDLYQGWSNLNNRINSILRLVHISIEIKSDDDYNDILPSLQYFSSEIIYFKDERFLPSNEFDIRLLRNIRSLYLFHYSINQYKYIHENNYPRLTNFFSLSMPWSFYEEILFGKIRFTNLKSIGCPRGASILLLNILNPINLTIKYLYLHSTSNEMLYYFLKYLANIISLKIDYFYSNNSSSIISLKNSNILHLTIVNSLSSQFHFHQLILSFQFSNLIYLKISFNTCDFQQLSNIITKLSSMKIFNLKVNTYPQDIDLISIRLINPWFLSLNYQYIIDQNQEKKILFINTTNKQID